MSASPWTRWLRSLLRPLPKKARWPGRLYLEPLEDRQAPATYIWTGNAPNGNWSLDANWLNNQHPSGLASNLDDLVFPSGPAATNTVNDLGAPGRPAVFNSISINASNYTLTGTAITLGTTASAGSGFVNVSANVVGTILGMDVQLGGPAGSNQFFRVDTGAQLTLSGELTGTTGSTLTKELAGTLTLAHKNQFFTGPIKVDNNGGILVITDALALGDTTSSVTVAANATLQVQNVSAPINKKLLLNGPGAINDGALVSASGTTTWAGNIELDSDATLGASAGSTLNILGQISDQGAGHNLTKEGAGQVVFSHIGGNVYHGYTAIHNGVLTIQDPLALGQPLPGGDPPSAANGTFVTQSVTEVGTLQLNFGGDSSLTPGDPNGILLNPSLPHNSATNPYIGFQVLDEQLALNGVGSAGLGALNNLNGNNNWAGSVILGSVDPNGFGSLSSPNIGVSGTSQLTLSGIVSSPNGGPLGFGFTKILPGKLILNNHNIYKGTTTVAAGAVNIRDSQALGDNGGAGTTVDSGAALELEVDGLNGETDAHGRPLAQDSVTGFGTPNTQLGLTVNTPLTLFGSGFGGAGALGTGALHSISGINVWTGNIKSLNAAIGVDADPHPSNTNNYFKHDYSLTVEGDLGGTNVTKVDPGQLILPNANTYSGTTLIQGGWITIRNDASLGPVHPGSDSFTPEVTVLPTAALHLKPFTPGTNLSLVKNLVLGGLGITAASTNFPLLSGKGALEVLGGDDTIGGPFYFVTGDVRRSTLQLNGIAGIGVELLGSDTFSELTVTASIADAAGTTGGGITKLGSRRLTLQADGTYTGPVAINEGVLRAQNNTALGTATSGTFTGSQVYTPTTTTVGLGIAELQTLTVSGAAGTFTLTFTDASGTSDTTNSLPTSATAAQVQFELNNLPNIKNAGGSVTVNQAGNVLAITFGGAFQGVNQQQLVATPSSGTVNITVNTLMDGDGTALELQHSLPAFNGGIQTGLNIWYDHLVLDSPGSTLFGDTPLTVLSSDNLWQGPVSLNVSSKINVPLNARLTVGGAIDDAADPGSELTKVGGGELALAGASTYVGTTLVSQGTLLVENSQALGGTGIADMQTLILTGSGTFQLMFNGQSTGTLNSASPTLAADVQAALNGLPIIGASDVGGAVTVSKSPSGNVLTVTFGGALLGFDQPQLTVPSTSSGLTVTPGTLVHGAGGTIVDNGAAIQVAGDLQVASEPLLIQGQGASAASAVPLGWFNEGPAPINNTAPISGQTPDNLPVAGSVTAVAVDPTNPDLIYLATAGGGAWKSKNGGLTWLPLFDSAPVQRLYVPSTTGKFTLTFNGQTTGQLDLGSLTLAADIQKALNDPTFASIGGLSPLPGSVTVTQSTVNPLVFYITFGGSLSQTTPPALTAAGFGTTSNPVVTSVTPVMYAGAIALDPNNPRTIYLGTGEFNNASDSYYGTGVYRSTDAGTTWTLLTNADGSNPLYGLGITKIVVDPGTGGPASGHIYVATSDQVVNAPVRGKPGVYRYDNATTQVQTLTVPTRTGLGTFTLSYGGSITGQLHLNSLSLASDIQSALNSVSFASIGGAGGLVFVTQSPVNPLVFTLTFEGALLSPAEPAGFPQPGTTWSNVTELPLDPALLVASGSNAPDPVVSPSSLWVNLTSATTVARQTQAGAPGTPGPNDDFRISFPQSNVTWSDLTLQYFDDTTPATGTAPSPGILPGQGRSVPVLYAALGTPGGSGSNAVFRTEEPNLAPADNVATIWYVGDPGAPQDEIQQITVSPWNNNPHKFYQLSFNGSALAPPIPGLQDDTDALVGIGNHATHIEAVLNGLPTIGNVGGSVSVILDPASNVTQLVFDVTFQGALADSPQPLIGVIPSGSFVTVTEKQKGAGIDTRSAGEFPTVGLPNGNIKVDSVTTGTATGGNPTFTQVTLYAAVTDSRTDALLEIEKSIDGGKTWAATAPPLNYMAAQGSYDSAILIMDPVTNPNTVYVGGMESSSATHAQQTFVTIDGGANWKDVSLDLSGRGEHASVHALAKDSSGRVVAGTDGGVWRLDPATGAWNDINGDLAVTQFNSIAGDPIDSVGAFGGARFNGTEQFSNGLDWSLSDNNDGGEVAISPTVNPANAKNIVYHVLNTNVLQPAAATLWRSTNDGAPGSWTQILTVPFTRYFPFVIDSVNTSRLLVGGVWPGTVIQESLDQGATWKSLNAPPTSVVALAAAAYQGSFTLDLGFAQVSDLGSNTYDPSTIYFTDGSGVYVTKNKGVFWLNRSAGLPSSLSDIEVDPADRDTVYVVRGTFDATGRKVFKSTDAGQSWTDLTFNLPDLPVYKLVLDPRTGDVYVGTEDGVWLLPGGSSTWQRFGSGLANVQVRDLELNQVTNTLLAGTYGRSMSILYLDDGAANAGALRAVSGAPLWKGPVILAGDATHPVAVSGSGTQALQNGTAAAQLNIQGTVSDLAPASNPRLVKIGGGNVVLSGSNIYGGITEVKEGVLVVHNAQALGSADPVNGYTVVDKGSALELQTDLQLEPVTVNGDGISFNGHNTGALYNVSNNNTYTGPLTLNTDSTIGVDTGTTLTIGTKAGLLGTGTITDVDPVTHLSNNRQLTKELTGTLILASANTYGGKTEVNQGALQVQNAQALGGTANGTDVLNGAQLQIQTPTTGPLAGQPVVVSGEALTLSGTGIFGSGALLDTGGNNTWQGPITLLASSSSAPTTVAVGTANTGDNLTLDGVVGQSGGTFGLQKVGLGRVTLTHTNTYGGLTTVAAGALRVQNAGALGTGGTAASGTVVIAGAALEVDGDPTGVGASLNVGNEFLTINGEGLASTGALRNVSGNNTWAGPVTLQFNANLDDAAVGADAGTQFTVTGTVQDSAVTLPQLSPVPASSLTKVGTGTLILPNPNTYGGKTFVNAGVLNIRNAQALGNSGPEVQTVTVSGPSGTFTLTFTGPDATGKIVSLPTDSLDVQDPNLAAKMQAALMKLSNIGGVSGTVTVTQGTANVYTVTFGGTLSIGNLPQMTSQVQPNSGVKATVATLRDGPEGTVVNPGASLQLQGGITVSTEALTLNGMGFNNAGALENVSGTSNTWAYPITLGSNSALGVDGPGDTLHVSAPIGDGGAALGVTEVGPGTVDYQAANTYTGLTTVNQGTLLLDDGTAPSLSGGLVIGDGLPGNAVARWLSANQVPDTAPVTVNSDGTLDLNGQTDTVGALGITDGQATTGASGSGQLTVASLNMTGGTFTAATAGGRLILAGDVTATSDGPALITGPGQLSLGGATRTITVNDGPQVIDLVINSIISGTGSEGLTKDGTGRLQLNGVSTYTGVTTAKKGDLEVDGTIGNVALAGGTLSGTGTVGTVGGQAPVAGTLDPGDNGAAPPIGILHSQTVTLGSGTTFFVDLAHTSTGSPVPGVDNDLLSVTGNVFLGGATLSGFTDPSVKLGDQFTVIQTTGGTVHGSFAQGSSVFLGTTKYTIDTATDPSKLVLTKVLASATVGVVSSQPSSTYGQDVTFTVTVTPEAGAPAIPTTDTLTITLDGTTYGPFHLDGSNQFMFKPQGPLGLNGPLSVGTHTLKVDFNDDNGDANYFPASTGLLNNFQVVAKAPTSVSLVPLSPVYGQTVTLTATIAPPLSSLVAGSVGPTQTVTFTVDGAPQSPPASVSNNQATSAPLSSSQVTTGRHTYTLTYSGDGNYQGSTQSGSFAVTKDNANVALNLSTTATSYGQAVTLSAKVTAALAGSPGIPSGTVTFWDGPVNGANSTRLGTAPLDGGGNASLPVSGATSLMLHAGTHTINVSYDGDTNYFSATGGGKTLTVSPDDTGTSVTSSVNPTAVGQSVTFTATVIDKVAGGPTPVGFVTFTIDSGTPTAPPTSLDISGKATYTLSTLTAGTHTIVANFLANNDFNASASPSSPPLTQTVLKPSQVIVGSSRNPSRYGQAVTFTATVSHANGFTGTPSGSVTFVIDNVPQSSSVPLDGSGNATITISNFSGGTHTVGATYGTDTASGFYQSTATPVTQTVTTAGTTTTVSASPTSSVYGQTVTLTATVANNDTSAPVNEGTVSFYDGDQFTGTFLGSKPVSGGTAALPTNALPAGASHTITAVYANAADFAGSSGSLTNFAVSQAHTSTAVSAAPTSSTYGQTVTLTATLTNTDTSAPVSGGTVSFFDGDAATGTLLGSKAVSGGTASIQTAALPAGASHTITAVYANAANFVGSNGSLKNFAVSQAHTSAAVSASPTSSVYGQAVTLTATLTNTDTAAPVSGGTVSFYDGDQFTGTLLGSSAVSGSGPGVGTASLPTNALPAGASQTITAVYANAPNFVGISGTLPGGYSVSQATTSTALSAAPNPVVYGQPVTFTATVTSPTAGPASMAGTTVTFTVDGASQPAVPLDANGQAKLTLSFQKLGSHAVSATYAGNSNLGGSGPADLNETVVAASAVNLASSLNPAVFGQTVTFAATVTSPTPGAGAVTGTVTFTVDGSAQQPAVILDGNGRATLTLSNLGGGVHAIGATYSGSSTIVGNSATPLPETVTRAASAVTLTTSGLPAAVGQPVTFTATVSSTGTTTVPSGTVTFVIDGASQPPVSLDANGQASLTLSTLTAGTHTVSATYGSDGNFAASSLQQPITVVVAPYLGTPNEVWISQVYHDLLSRAADPAGLTFWEDQLEAGTPRAAVASDLVNSDEYRRDFIVHLFRDLLHRVASTDEVNFHLAFLDGGGTYEQLTANFLGSAEYLGGGGRSDPATFLNDVYQYVLGHAAGGDALQYWGGFLQSHSPRDTALAILQTPEAVGRFVRLQYEKLFGREPDGAPNFWFTALQQGTRDETFLTAMIASDEYFMRGAPFHNTQAQEKAWISQVYVDVLGHAIDAAGQASWFNALEHGTPRLQITEQVVNSADYRNRLINKLFQTLLNRAPSGNDLSVYQNYLLQGQTVEQLKATIMGSAEYYFGRGGGTAGGFLSAAYHDVLQRPIDAAGTQYWGSKLAGEDRATLALQLLTTLDADEVVVQEDYLAGLHRSADPSGQAYWADQLQAGFRDEYVLAELAATKEYFNRFKTS
jgi:autotransporter-associated beta strand protein